MLAEELLDKVCASLTEWHNDNYDNRRFGKPGCKKMVKGLLGSRLGYRDHRRIEKRGKIVCSLLERLQNTWDLLEGDHSKNLLVELLAYRVLGYRHVKLSTNTPEYWQILEKWERKSESTSDGIDTGFLHFRLSRMVLKEFKLQMEAYIRPPTIMSQFYFQQYRFAGEGRSIGVEEGDVVLDCGGCWGETAIHFSELAGPSGKVLSFEFVPSNLEIFRRNLEINPEFHDRIKVVEHPLWSTGQRELYFKDSGPGSMVKSTPFEKATGSVAVRSIDEVVKEEALSNVSFIKMDIEGAEWNALRGAEDTLKRYKPKLAISLYHSLDDFCRIPEYLNKLVLGYKFFLKHATIHTEETVLFATVE